ncbi:MAG: SLC45 family MFS transporter [Muribaculaceae bacterium]|nr:SLC45 family MFS transporter [Muribaculaceae bacterium]
MKTKPDLSFWKLFNLSFGFFGVQIAYALQTANISRIFQTLGADPKTLSFFWILPPLMGLIVQPFVGKWSDRTWCKLGRRIPYLIAGTAVSVLVMCLLPNAGRLSSIFWVAMLLGTIILMLLDTSLNMAMQPFKMMVGDMVNEKQKTKAYSIQSFLVNAGQVVGSVLPFALTYFGVSNDASAGVPKSLTYAFYVGAAVLILCVIYTCLSVKEMPPEEYKLYHGDISQESGDAKLGMTSLLKKAPAAFWQVGLVQFFCWAAFLFMWNYSTGTLAETCWGTADANSKGFQDAGDWVGVVFGVESIAAVLWAITLPYFKERKTAYIVSIILGAIGFFMIPFIHNQYLLILPYALIGCTWSAMLALPFTIITNALEGDPHMGTYLGLFNGTICIPQIVASIAGFGFMYVFEQFGLTMKTMMFVSAILLVCGAFFVTKIKETHGMHSAIVNND